MRQGQKGRSIRAKGRGAAGVITAVALMLAAGPAALAAQVALGRAETVAARVWLDRGNEPLLRVGDQVRVYYRTVQDAYVAIFHIDTDGTTTLVLPGSPDEDHYVRGGRDYRVLFPRSPYWYVDDQPGVGYFFIIASPEPFDFSRFHFSHYDLGWDLSLVGRQVYRDPYLAMDDYVATLLPDWQRIPYALDFTSYNVGARFQYPRFLCYDCHGFRSYSAWNPYYSSCTSFRVVIYHDPYFYPAQRYRADRVVWAKPISSDRPRFAFQARANGEPQGLVIRTRTISGARPKVSAPAPAPRRSAQAGAGGVAPSPQTAPAGTPTRVPAEVVRGREVPSPSARVGPAVAAPAPRTLAPGPAPAREAEPAEGASGPTGDQRSRPVLRKRPNEGAGSTTQPSAAPRSAPTPTRQAPPRAAPRTPPAAAPRTRQEPARRPDPPVVRRTPDGRPVVRPDR